MVPQIVSNGIYRSIEHRATVNQAKERLSIATFYSPKLDGDLGPAPSLITPETPALFRRIGVADYLRDTIPVSFVENLMLMSSEFKMWKMIRVPSPEVVFLRKRAPWWNKYQGTHRKVVLPFSTSL